ncbi:MAG: ABC transporter permease [Oscillospiraceae bacterium]|nr:ABC transporter permease [Oscillospiraceae bacterium]
MRLDYMLKSRLLGALRDPFSLVFIVLAIIISIGAAAFTLEKEQAGLTVAVVSDDVGAFSQKLIGYLSEYDSFSVHEMSYDEAMRLLKQDRLEAAIVIHSDFSEKISKGEFENTVDLMTSPSSQAPATISEPIVNSILMLWMEELSIITAKDYLLEHGKSYTGNDEYEQREQIKKLWKSGSLVKIVRIDIDGEEPASVTSGPFGTCVKWYGALCMFYLVVGASWVLDINKKTLRVRMLQMGVRQWQVVIANGLAPLAVCLAGYIIAGIGCSVLMGAGIEKLALCFFPMMVYLIGLLGITLLTASLLKSIFSLMFLAPVFTFLNGVLSGLLLELPDWAYVLKWLSGALPGRWLYGALDSPINALPWALICALVWICSGIGVSYLCVGKQRV